MGVVLNKYFLDMRVMGQQAGQLSPLTEWFPVVAVETDTGPRLSGSEMRGQLFFATPKGNAQLYGGQTKTALVRHLPAV